MARHRAPFNTTCDLFCGPGSATPGDLRGTFDCRLVPDPNFILTGDAIIQRSAWLTVVGVIPRGAWTAPYWGVDASLADLVASPSGSAISYWVWYTEQCLGDPSGAYFRAQLIGPPLPIDQPGGVYLTWHGTGGGLYGVGIAGLPVQGSPWTATCRVRSVRQLVGYVICVNGGGIRLIDVNSCGHGHSHNDQGGLFTYSTITDGVWHALAASYDGSVHNLYLNGVLVDQKLVAISWVTDPTQGVEVGEVVVGGVPDKMSLIDARVYDTCLLPVEIATIAAGPPNVAFGSPVRWYKMDELSGLTIYDSSPNVDDITWTDPTQPAWE